MKATATDKASRMLAAQERKLTASIPALMNELGFTPIPDHYARGWQRTIGNTTIEVTEPNEGDGRPWLACKFNRPYPRPDLPWDAPENRRQYRDLADALGANAHSGKCNCHIWHRVTAKEAVDTFRQHLAIMLDVLECA